MISIKKVATIGATVALLSAAAVPAFAGNFSHSGNSTDIDQKNKATITNDVDSSSNTGKNTGSSSSCSWLCFGSKGSKVETGNAKTEVSVATVANSNSADVSTCGCQSNKHGKNSSNKVDVDQSNKATITNDVDSKSNTGKNTGNYVETGNAKTDVAVLTVVNENVVTN